MSILGKWKTLSIRTKVNMLILPAVLPVMAVAWLTYGAYRSKCDLCSGPMECERYCSQSANLDVYHALL